MKLTIITINYNNVKGLQKTIDSVVSQTWRGFEWIVVDGGSKDGSKELIEKYAKQGVFSWWCSEPDNGIYNAMNKGITHATGNYCLFLNSGDELYDTDVLRNFTESIKRKTADIFYGDCAFVELSSVHIEKYEDDISLFSLYYKNISHQATFISTMLLKQTPYDETYRMVADFKFWLNCMLSGVRFTHLPFVVCRFYMDGITATNVDLGREERTRMLNETVPQPILKSLFEHEQLMKDHDVIKERCARKIPRMVFKMLDRWQKIKR